MVVEHLAVAHFGGGGGGDGGGGGGGGGDGGGAGGGAYRLICGGQACQVVGWTTPLQNSCCDIPFTGHAARQHTSGRTRPG